MADDDDDSSGEFDPNQDGIVAVTQIKTYKKSLRNSTSFSTSRDATLKPQPSHDVKRTSVTVKIESPNFSSSTTNKNCDNDDSNETSPTPVCCSLPLPSNLSDTDDADKQSDISFVQFHMSPFISSSSSSPQQQQQRAESKTPCANITQEISEKLTIPWPRKNNGHGGYVQNLMVDLVGAGQSGRFASYLTGIDLFKMMSCIIPETNEFDKPVCAMVIVPTSPKIKSVHEAVQWTRCFDLSLSSSSADSSLQLSSVPPGYPLFAFGGRGGSSGSSKRKIAIQCPFDDSVDSVLRHPDLGLNIYCGQSRKYVDALLKSADDCDDSDMHLVDLLLEKTTTNSTSASTLPSSSSFSSSSSSTAAILTKIASIPFQNDLWRAKSSRTSSNISMQCDGCATNTISSHMTQGEEDQEEICLCTTESTTWRLVSVPLSSNEPEATTAADLQLSYASEMAFVVFHPTSSNNVTLFDPSNSLLNFNPSTRNDTDRILCFELWLDDLQSRNCGCFDCGENTTVNTDPSSGQSSSASSSQRMATVVLDARKSPIIFIFKSFKSDESAASADATPGYSPVHSTTSPLFPFSSHFTSCDGNNQMQSPHALNRMTEFGFTFRYISSSLPSLQGTRGEFTLSDSLMSSSLHSVHGNKTILQQEIGQFDSIRLSDSTRNTTWKMLMLSDCSTSATDYLFPANSIYPYDDGGVDRYVDTMLGQKHNHQDRFHSIGEAKQLCSRIKREDHPVLKALYSSRKLLLDKNTILVNGGVGASINPHRTAFDHASSRHQSVDGNEEILGSLKQSSWDDQLNDWIHEIIRSIATSTMSSLIRHEHSSSTCKLGIFDPDELLSEDTSIEYSKWIQRIRYSMKSSGSEDDGVKTANYDSIAIAKPIVHMQENDSILTQFGTFSGCIPTSSGRGGDGGKVLWSIESEVTLPSSNLSSNASSCFSSNSLDSSLGTLSHGDCNVIGTIPKCGHDGSVVVYWFDIPDE